MTANVYYADDADPSLLQGKTVAVIGYGSQGHGHALNLKDSGVDVIVGLREGASSVAKAESQGLKVLPIAAPASCHAAAAGWVFSAGGGGGPSGAARPGSQGLRVLPTAEAAAAADVVM